MIIVIINIIIVWNSAILVFNIPNSSIKTNIVEYQLQICILLSIDKGLC